MNKKILNIISTNLELKDIQVEKTINLLSEGATIPFISRYRKEVTGSLDEVQVAAIKDQYDKLEELELRKQTILKTIKEQDKLNPELEQRINDCFDKNELEDIYLPFKPKRKTKASIAREKGLEPLAKIVMKQLEQDPENRAVSFLNNDVNTTEEALSGARDIIAEWINENENARNTVRRSFEIGAIIKSRIIKNKEEEGEKYRDYFEYSEPLKRCPSHRLLAIRRAEKEGILKVSVFPDEKETIERLSRIFVKGNNACSDEVIKAVKDSYKRLLQPSIETEFSQLAKEKADEEAINVFVKNLRQLLLEAPLGQKE